MKNLFLKSIFPVFIIVLATSCINTETKRRLNDIESYIMERPDSALAVLDTMDRSLLKSERLRAHHALLHAMALDKNFIDVDDDSLASVAVEYYSKKGPDKYYARSLYYLGLSYYYAQDYKKAILEFTKAEKVAERCDSLYWGFVKMAQADTYSKTYNEVEEFQCLEQAHKIYSELSVPYYNNVSKLRLAEVYFNLGYKEKADSLLSILTSDVNLSNNIRLSAIADRAFILTTRSVPNNNEAVELYEYILRSNETSFLTAKDYWAYANALNIINQKEESQCLVDQLSVIDSSATSYYWRYRIEKHNGNIATALLFLEKFTTSNNEEVTESLKQSLALSQRDYYESLFEVAEYKAKNRMLFIISIVIASFLIIGMTLWYISGYIRIQNLKQVHMMEYVEEIRHQMSQFEKEEYPDLKRKYITLYRSRFEAIGTLCEEYLKNKDRNDVEKVMYQKVMLMIDDIRNDKARRLKFESLLDSELDDIMTHFRNEMPKSKEWEVTMFSYLVAGFDSTTISRLLDMPLNNVYAYKRRLRLKIEEKNPEHASQFLEMIS